MREYTIFPELSGGKIFYGIKQTRRSFRFVETKVIWYCESKQEAERWIEKFKEKDKLQPRYHSRVGRNFHLAFFVLAVTGLFSLLITFLLIISTSF